MNTAKELRQQQVFLLQKVERDFGVALVTGMGAALLAVALIGFDAYVLKAAALKAANTSPGLSAGLPQVRVVFLASAGGALALCVNRLWVGRLLWGLIAALRIAIGASLPSTERGNQHGPSA